jgi:nucleoside-diphosphate-sugar epimerase
MSMKNVVLIAGAHGVSGRAAAEHWTSFPGTRVYGLSRRSAPLPAGAEVISADLLDRDDLQRKLGKITGITHIVFGAYIEEPSATERSEANVAILKNLLDVVETTSPSLRHVTFYMPAADPIPTPLTVYMADKKPVWEVIVRKHGLQPLPYEQVSSWPFADAILRLMEYDNVTSTIKARRAGFHDCIDTEEMFKSFFARLRKDRVIP